MLFFNVFGKTNLLSRISLPYRQAALHRGRKRARLGLESLENRVVPAPFAPDSFLRTPVSTESNYMEHFHVHLRILIDGVEHIIPGDTNIVQAGTPAGDAAIARGVMTGFYPIHVHKEDLQQNPPNNGKLHIESTQVFDFHLKDFFTIWTLTSGSEKLLTSQELKMTDSNGQNIDFKVDAMHTLTMTVNGGTDNSFGNFVLTDPMAGGDNLGPNIVITGTTLPPPTMGGPTQVFVTTCYANLLGRQPDGPGMSYFSSLIDQHLVSRAQVSLAIETSLECRTKQVTDMYQQMLGRAPDGLGLQLAITFIGAGGSMITQREVIASSPEYLQHHQGTNSGFAAGLYQDALGRSIDAFGQSAAIPALDNGFSHPALVNQLFESPEASQHIVQGYYMLFLHRQADDAGLNNRAALIQQGTHEELIVAAITGSDEYASSM